MKSPAFQFYPDDFLAGVADMKQGEVGAYILLLCHQWNCDSIPSQLDRLRRIAKGKVTSHVLRKFPNGKNARLERVRQNLLDYREQKRLAGKNGADKRWQNHSTPMAEPSESHSTPAMRLPLAKNSSLSPSPSPNSKLTTKGEKVLTKGGRELAQEIETLLGKQWVNDAGKWVNRIKNDFYFAARVIAEVKSAVREQRIKTTPAQYAEQIWKEFQ